MSLTPEGMPLISGYTPEQTKEIYDLGVECQELGVQLTKEFHTLAGLEAMGHMATQATAHETVMEGQPERATAYNVLIKKDGGMSVDEYKVAVQKPCSEVKAWLDTNSVIFNHQLELDAKLASLISAEKNLQAKWGHVWAQVQQIAYVAGVPPDLCLDTALRILGMIPVVPINLSYYAPTPIVSGFTLCVLPLASPGDRGSRSEEESQGCWPPEGQAPLLRTSLEQGCSEP